MTGQSNTYNYPVNLQNETLSELILCNADNSNIYNVTIEGSATKKNNMLYVHRTDNSRFTNITSTNNYIYFASSSNNILTDNAANSNSNYGIYLFLWYSSSNTIYNNLFNNTNNFGFSNTVNPNTWNTTKTAGPNIAPRTPTSAATSGQSRTAQALATPARIQIKTVYSDLSYTAGLRGISMWTICRSHLISRWIRPLPQGNAGNINTMAIWVYIGGNQKRQR